jgi:hypothetical protein
MPPKSEQSMHEHEVRTVVAEVLAEQRRQHNEQLDEVVSKAVAAILTSFGIEEADRKELRRISSISAAGEEASSRRRLHIQGCHYRHRWRLCRSRWLGFKDPARQVELALPLLTGIVMLKSAILAGALLCALSINAEARQRKAVVADPGCNVLWPCEGVAPSPRGEHIAKALGVGSAQKVYTPSFGSISRPIRYVAGRLICAINVNLALAERGIKGTGSALAHSFDHWGIRVAYPVPGAVAVTDRRGGGHVAIVARVDPDGRVLAWNPSPRGRGWELVEYTHRHARYRVAEI